MTDLMENPLLILFIGGGLTVMLVIGWLRTGQRGVLIAALISLLGTIGLLVIERLVITDRETVRATLREMARDVENNDVEKVVQHVHPYAEHAIQQARREMPRYEFQSVRITRIHDIKVNRNHEPSRADVEFSVVVILSDEYGVFRNRRIPRFVQMTLYEHDDRWKVVEYVHHPPRGLHGDRY